MSYLHSFSTARSRHHSSPLLSFSTRPTTYAPLPIVDNDTMIYLPAYLITPLLPSFYKRTRSLEDLQQPLYKRRRTTAPVPLTAITLSSSTSASIPQIPSPTLSPFVTPTPAQTLSSQYGLAPSPALSPLVRPTTSQSLAPSVRPTPSHTLTPDTYSAAPTVLPTSSASQPSTRDAKINLLLQYLLSASAAADNHRHLTTFQPSRLPTVASFQPTATSLRARKRSARRTLSVTPTNDMWNEF